MSTEKTFSFSFIGIVKKLCIELDVTIDNIEYLPNNKIKFFFSGDDISIISFIHLIDIEYKGFTNWNPQGEKDVFTTT
jgi:hypothetical protein